MHAAGTTIPNALPIRNNDDMNTANTAVVKLGERVFALVGRGLRQRGRSRHPGHARSDDLAQRPGRRAVFRAPAAGARRQRLELRLARLLRRHRRVDLAHRRRRHACAHRRARIARAGVPAQLRDDATNTWCSCSCRIAWREGERRSSSACNSRPISPAASRSCPRMRSTRRAGSKRRSRRSITSPMPMSIAAKSWCSAAWHTDVDEARSPMVAAMRGERGSQKGGTELVSLRLDLARNRARWETARRQRFRVPDLRRAHSGRSAGDVVCARHPWRPPTAPYFNAIASIDTRADRVRVHRYGADVMAEEHRFRAEARLEHARRRVVSRDAARLQARAQRRRRARRAASGPGRSRSPGFPTPYRWASTAGSPGKRRTTPPTPIKC